jgi:hypothetical protein
VTIKFKLSGRAKPVDGFSLGKYFATHQIKDGWKVTHLPSGLALCDPCFDSKETAQILVMAIEMTYKDSLNCDDPLILQKDVATEYRQNQKSIRDFLNLLNAHPETIVAGYFMDFFKQQFGI